MDNVNTTWAVLGISTKLPTFNGTSIEAIHDAGEVPLSSKILGRITAGITVIGLLANLGSLLTLLRAPQGFSPAILFLLRLQSFLDAIACLFTTILILAPADLLSGIEWIDVIICYAWHSHAFFWGWILMSIFNLVNIAVDRYRCVCKPIDYYQSGMSRWYAAAVALPVFSFIFSSGSYFQTRLVDGVCLHKYRWDGELMVEIMFIFAATTLFTFYVIPVILLVTLYGRVIYFMRRRCADSQTPTSRVMNKATRQITKTAIVVTCIFIFTLGYDSIYYFLGYAGWVTYVVNSPIQRVGVLLAGFNNCANPFVYVALMPTYKRNVLNMWRSCFGNTESECSESSSGTTGSTETVNFKGKPSKSTETINSAL